MSRLLFFALGAVLCLCTFCSVPSEALKPIHPDEKAFILNWLAMWKNTSSLFTINTTTTDCNNLVRTKSVPPFSSVECRDDAIQPYSRVVTLGLWNVVGELADSAASTTIPASISVLSEVTGLILSGVAFTGTIPEELIKLPKLQVLAINGNNLYGTIPMALENSTLTYIDISHNMFSGPIPDISKLANLGYIRFSGNNFGCPQPYIRPSLTTQSRLPRFRPGNCSFDNNLFALPEYGYNTVCGERIEDYISQAACSYKVQPVPVVARPSNPQWSLNPTNGTLKVEIQNGRHAYVPIDPITGRDGDIFMTTDFFSVSTYPIATRDVDSTHATYRFKGYKSVTPLPSNPLIYRFSGELEGTGAQFDTIWDFSRQANEVKFSFEIRNMTFLPGHDRITINMQIGIKVPVIKSSMNVANLNCKGRNLLNLMDFRSEAAVFQCTGIATEIRLNIDIQNYNDVSFLLDLSDGKTNASISFPILYEKDGTPHFLAATNSRIQIAPFGAAESLNFLGVPGHPAAQIYQQQLVSDPTGQNQFCLLSIGIEMESFQTALLYDPTVLLSTVFGPVDDAPRSPQTVQEINIVAIAAGSVAAAVFAIVAVVAVAAVYSPRFRSAIRPFRMNQKKALSDFQDEDDPDRARAAPTTGSSADPKKISRSWVAAQPHSIAQ